VIHIGICKEASLILLGYACTVIAINNVEIQKSAAEVEGNDDVKIKAEKVMIASNMSNLRFIFAP